MCQFSAYVLEKIFLYKGVEKTKTSNGTLLMSWDSRRATARDLPGGKTVPY